MEHLHRDELKILLEHNRTKPFLQDEFCKLHELLEVHGGLPNDKPNNVVLRLHRTLCARLLASGKKRHAEQDNDEKIYMLPQIRSVRSAHSLLVVVK